MTLHIMKNQRHILKLKCICLIYLDRIKKEIYFMANIFMLIMSVKGFYMATKKNNNKKTHLIYKDFKKGSSDCKKTRGIKIHIL